MNTNRALETARYEVSCCVGAWSDDPDAPCSQFEIVGYADFMLSTPGQLAAWMRERLGVGVVCGLGHSRSPDVPIGQLEAALKMAARRAKRVARRWQKKLAGAPN
jgi:hypothetical protein